MSQQLAMDALTMAIVESGQTSSIPNIPPHTKVVSVELWRQTYYSMSTADYEARKKAFKRASGLNTADKVSTCSLYSVRTAWNPASGVPFIAKNSVSFSW